MLVLHVDGTLHFLVSIQVRSCHVSLDFRMGLLEWALISSQSLLLLPQRNERFFICSQTLAISLLNSGCSQTAICPGVVVEAGKQSGGKPNDAVKYWPQCVTSQYSS